MSMHRLEPMFSRRRLFGAASAVIALVGAGVGVAVGVSGTQSDGPPTAEQRTDYANVVPAPVSAVAAGGQFTVSAGTGIQVTAGATEAADALRVGDYLSALLKPAAGQVPAKAGDGASKGIRLVLTSSGGANQSGGSSDKQLGTEGYRLDVSDDLLTITANEPSGLFHGVQTLRQLLPPQMEKQQADKQTAQKVAWTVPSGHIVDYPRFTYRAAGLDVARHFFSVTDVERYIDEVALYKVNYLHLHLTDDQGWRLAIDGWPNLTATGAKTEVGAGAGGFYTQDDYRKLVAYAQSRFITIVPEIDVPGHVTAALASYPRLSCDGKPRRVFTGIAAGFSSLCASKPTTYTFLDDVFRQLAALTPGPYIGIGGDEAQATSPGDYTKIVSHVASDVRSLGKMPWGWQESIPAAGKHSVATDWSTTLPTTAITRAANAGTQLVLDPANHTYLDQKYDASTKLGLHWAGYVDVRDAYNWDPASYLPGVDPTAVIGVEADLWTETIASDADIDYMAFPRLPAVAELGWSPAAVHHWAAFQSRLASQGPRWRAMGIGYYHSPQIPWPAGS